MAELYGVETRVLNQAVKRNIERFPERFRFQLTKEEMAELVTNCDRFNSLKHSTVRSYAFTEQGVAMLSTVLRSETAIRVSIRIAEHSRLWIIFRTLTKESSCWPGGTEGQYEDRV